MTKIGVVFFIFLSLHCTWSYYPYSPSPAYSPRMIYRPHISPYQPQATYMQPMHMRPVPVMHYAPIPSPMMHYQAATPVSYFMPKPHPMYTPYGASPASSHHNGYFSGAPPPRAPRFPLKEIFSNPLQGVFSSYPSKPSIFNKVKPYLFGSDTGPRSLPHHPFYPDYFPPHQFVPNRPFQNRPSAHHAYPVHIPGPAPSMALMKPEKSCSCSLHVGQLTVYKHTDMRSSYSCTDLKDCNSFCTNLFSSEDLRAQTRSDACLILGKDTSVPWFRRDHACEPHGVKNDTKLSVDLCCKDLQPC